jgi:hypothetical protein
MGAVDSVRGSLDTEMTFLTATRLGNPFAQSALPLHHDLLRPRVRFPLSDRDRQRTQRQCRLPSTKTTPPPCAFPLQTRKACSQTRPSSDAGPTEGNPDAAAFRPEGGRRLVPVGTAICWRRARLSRMKSEREQPGARRAGNLHSGVCPCVGSAASITRRGTT